MSQNIIAKYDKIPMITIATYTFTKIILTMIKAVKQHNNTSIFILMIRYVSYVEVAVSILNLQRSMILSFGGMSNSVMLNSITGAFVVIFILILGILMITRKELL